MKKLQFVLTAIALFSFLVSCTETVAPVLTGDISGFVSLYEEDYSRIVDKSGVKVSIEGNNDFAFTNADGKFTLKNAEAGIFNIIFEKSGFGLNKIISYQFVGGGEAFIYNVSLSKLPSFNVVSLNILKTSDEPPQLLLEGDVTGSVNHSRQVGFYFGKSESVSNYPQDFITSYSGYIYPDSSHFSDFIWNYKQFFVENGFHIGETIYVAAYSISGYGDVYDPVTGKYFNYNVGTSPVKSSFILD